MVIILEAEASHYFRGGNESLFYGRKRIIALVAETGIDLMAKWGAVVEGWFRSGKGSEREGVIVLEPLFRGGYESLF